MSWLCLIIKDAQKETSAKFSFFQPSTSRVSSHIRITKPIFLLSCQGNFLLLISICSVWEGSYSYPVTVTTPGMVSLPTSSLYLYLGSQLSMLWSQHGSAQLIAFPIFKYEEYLVWFHTWVLVQGRKDKGEVGHCFFCCLLCMEEPLQKTLIILRPLLNTPFRRDNCKKKGQITDLQYSLTCRPTLQHWFLVFHLPAASTHQYFWCQMLITRSKHFEWLLKWTMVRYSKL